MKIKIYKHKGAEKVDKIPLGSTEGMSGSMMAGHPFWINFSTGVNEKGNVKVATLYFKDNEERKKFSRMIKKSVKRILNGYEK